MSAIIPVVAGAIPVVQQAIETDLTITEKILEILKSMNCNSACCGSEKIIITPITPYQLHYQFHHLPSSPIPKSSRSASHHN